MEVPNILSKIFNQYLSINCYKYSNPVPSWLHHNLIQLSNFPKTNCSKKSTLILLRIRDSKASNICQYPKHCQFTYMKKQRVNFFLSFLYILFSIRSKTFSFIGKCLLLWIQYNLMSKTYRWRSTQKKKPNSLLLFKLHEMELNW